MRILQVSTQDRGGGAERVAMMLHHGYQMRGHDAYLAVGRRLEEAPRVIPIPNEEIRRKQPWTGSWLRLSDVLTKRHIKGMSRLGRLARTVAMPRRAWEQERGIEDFCFPATKKLTALPPLEPQIIHMHNLHGNYFDLCELPHLTKAYPCVITLHDMWMLTGHCAYSIDCPRWEQGCGKCPDLTLYPRIKRDATAYNWQRKRDIYTKSRLYVASPSQWLLDFAERSILREATIEGRVIHNGVDQSIFHPAEKTASRDALSLPQDRTILLFSAAQMGTNPFKDYSTIHDALAIVAQKTTQPILLLALGSDAPNEKLSEQVEIRYIPFLSDPTEVARYNQASDIYLHAAKADNFPNAILEALSCGLPCIATDVGGINEQIMSLPWKKKSGQMVENASGVLTEKGNPKDMADAILYLLSQPKLQTQLSENAARDALERFNFERQIEIYLNWFEEILHDPH